jgi:hypothetical protein
VLDAEHLARAAQARLDLIRNEKDVLLLAHPAENETSTTGEWVMGDGHRALTVHRCMLHGKASTLSDGLRVVIHSPIRSLIRYCYKVY